MNQTRVLTVLMISLICAGSAAAAVQFPDDREVMSFGLQPHIGVPAVTE